LLIDIVINDQLSVILNKIVILDDDKYDGVQYYKQTKLLTWQFTLT
jgi:hypothetical protein